VRIYGGQYTNSGSCRHTQAETVDGEGGNRLWGGTDRWIQALLLSPFVGHKLRPLSSKPNKKVLQFLLELIEAGKVTPIIDRTYPLSDVPDAFRYLKGGHARGKVVTTV
jgi:NADPH:quinone reductase-like Zn-dependent oxidoreductase